MGTTSVTELTDALFLSLDACSVSLVGRAVAVVFYMSVHTYILVNEERVSLAPPPHYMCVRACVRPGNSIPKKETGWGVGRSVSQ